MPTTHPLVTASPADAAQVLEDAADLLLIHGRCRHVLENDAGELCALGAILAATDGAGGTFGTLFAAATTPLVRTLRARGPVDDIADWNNDPATTDDEVRDTLLLVAKDLRNTAVPS